MPLSSDVHEDGLVRPVKITYPTDNDAKPKRKKKPLVVVADVEKFIPIPGDIERNRRIMDELITKFNHNHDDHGRFGSGDGGAVKVNFVGSDAAEVEAAKPIAMEALGAIGQVINAPKIKNVTIRVVTPAEARAKGLDHLTQGWYMPGEPGVLNMQVTGAGKAEAVNTLVHEYGHMLDVEQMGHLDLAKKEVKFASSDAYDNIGKWAGFSDAVGRSRSVDFIMQNADKDTIDYLMSPAESFARAFSQYVGQKSGNASLNESLTNALSTQFGQWGHEDFKPVSKSLDEIFKSQGLLLDNKPFKVDSAGVITKYNQNHDDHGRFSSGAGGAERFSLHGNDGKPLPPEFGTQPIPAGTIRMVHMTKSADAAIAIAHEGIKVHQPIEGPAGVWGAEPVIDSKGNARGFYGDVKDNYSIEYAIPKGDFQMFGVHTATSLPLERDVKPSEVLAVHLPWHSKARYIMNNPDIHATVMSGEADYLMSDPTYGEAITWVKANSSIQKFNQNHGADGRFSSGGGGTAWATSANADEWNNLTGHADLYKEELDHAAMVTHDTIAAVGAPVVPVTVVGSPYGPDGMRNSETVGFYQPDNRGVITLNQRSGLGTQPYFAVHEYAHLLDFEHYKARGPQATSDSKSALAPLMKSIRNSPQASGWLYGPDGAYWGSNTEMFARAFAQYVTVKTGNPELQHAFESQAAKQWPTADFAPISAAFDKLFSKT